MHKVLEFIFETLIASYTVVCKFYLFLENICAWLYVSFCYENSYKIEPKYQWQNEVCIKYVQKLLNSQKLFLHTLSQFNIILFAFGILVNVCEIVQSTGTVVGCVLAWYCIKCLCCYLSTGIYCSKLTTIHNSY